MSVGIRKKATAVLFFGAVVLGSSLMVNADDSSPAKVTGVKQVYADASSIAISWNNATYTGCVVEYTSDMQNWQQQIVESSETSIDVEAAGTYYVRIKAFNAETVDSVEKNFGEYSDVIEVVSNFDNSVKTTIAQKDCTGNSVSVSWSAVEKADSYKVVLKDSDKQIKTKVVGESKITFKKLKEKKYTVEVYAQRASKEGFTVVSETPIGIVDSVATLPSKIKKVRVEELYHSSKSALIQWNSSKSASGVQVELYNIKGKKLKVTDIKKKNEVNLKKIGYDTFYKVRVRGYVKINNKKKYGEWSDYIYFTNGVSAAVVSRSGRISLDWNEVKGAKNYDVFVSEKEKSGYKKMISNTERTKFIHIEKCGKKELKRGKKYYIKIVSKGKDKKKKISQSIVYSVKIG